MSLPPLKPHQIRGLDQLRDMRARTTGEPIMGVAPPGAGKSRVMLELACAEVADGGRVVIKSHRRMLSDQLAAGFEDQGIPYTILSPDSEFDESCPIAIVSTQTLHSRAIIRGAIDLPKATLVLNDEAHQQSGAMERSILFGSYRNGTRMTGYLERGADIVGFTATPLIRKNIYKHLIDFGSYSELRRAGMHQMVRVFGPDEIDTTGLTKRKDGDYAAPQLAKRVHVIFGSVFEHWQKLNPNAYPAILFAPSGASSAWFAHQFVARGVAAAHIGGDKVWMPEGGRMVQYESTREIRDELLRQSKSGEIKVICNRFVLREAIDMPWLYHGIFATVMGSLTTALQSVGRLQRFWPEYEEKIMQDHGGFYWRHGSPNMDRKWTAGMTAEDASAARVRRVLAGEEKEGIRCPKCGAWRTKGGVCLNPACKHQHEISTRVVHQLNGHLKEIHGAVFSGENAKPQADKLWAQTLFMMGAMNRPVSSAVALFVKKCKAHGMAVDLASLRNAPPDKSSHKWDLSVRDVYPWTSRK